MIKEKTTIAIFAAHFPPCPGGIAKFMGITADALAKEGSRVVVVTSDFNNPEPENEDVILIKLPIHHNWFGASRYPIPKKNSEYKKYIKMLESMNIDRVIALTRFHPTSYVAAKFAGANNIPLYLLECGANSLTLGNKFLDVGLHIVEKALTTRIKPFVYQWGAMSKAGIEFLKSEYSVTGEFVWPCSVKVPSRVKKATTPDEVTITYAGRIENIKGEDELARAFVELADKYDNIKLNFLGEGGYLSVLKSKYKHDRIKYWGNVGPDTVDAVNLGSDISVCATRFPDGAVPNAVLEAGSMKCALITSPNGGFNDLMVNEYNGIVTKPDLSDMKECLERLIEAPRLREKLAENIYNDIQQKYDPTSVAKIILKDMELA